MADMDTRYQHDDWGVGEMVDGKWRFPDDLRNLIAQSNELARIRACAKAWRAGEALTAHGDLIFAEEGQHHMIPTNVIECDFIVPAEWAGEQEEEWKARP